MDVGVGVTAGEERQAAHAHSEKTPETWRTGIFVGLAFRQRSAMKSVLAWWVPLRGLGQSIQCPGLRDWSWASESSRSCGCLVRLEGIRRTVQWCRVRLVLEPSHRPSSCWAWSSSPLLCRVVTVWSCSCLCGWPMLSSAQHCLALYSGRLLVPGIKLLCAPAPPSCLTALEGLPC